MGIGPSNASGAVPLVPANRTVKHGAVLTAHEEASDQANEGRRMRWW